MNKRLGLLLSSLFIHCGASAQSTVTIGGILDGGVVMVNTGTGLQKYVQSGNYYGSRLIISATEDLGGGYRANAYLEPGLFLDNGSTSAAGFYRRSLVGLEGGFGRVDLGRDYNPMFSVVVRTDPFEGGTLAAGTSFQVAAGAQANNAVFYSTPLRSGFRAKVMYALGEPAAPPNTNGNREGANFFWDIGPVTTFGAWGRQVSQVGTTPKTIADSQTMLGAQYKFSSGYITASYQFGHNNSGSVTYASNNNAPYARSFATALVGFRAFIPNSFFEVGATYQLYNDKTAANQDASLLGLGAFYNLSKRSLLYFNAALLRNERGQKFTFVDAGRNAYSYTPPTGRTIDPKGLAFGLRHVF